MPEIESRGIRKISHTEAKKEITTYIEEVGYRPHISELAEELYIDFDLIERIIKEIYNEL